MYYVLIYLCSVFLFYFFHSGRGLGLGGPTFDNRAIVKYTNYKKIFSSWSDQIRRLCGVPPEQ